MVIVPWSGVIEACPFPTTVIVRSIVASCARWDCSVFACTPWKPEKTVRITMAATVNITSSGIRFMAPFDPFIIHHPLRLGCLVKAPEYQLTALVT
jgi:hypothetical protein